VILLAVSQRGRVVSLKVTELRVAITVADFDRALAFYRDVACHDAVG
jgi:hypothetical protein